MRFLNPAGLWLLLGIPILIIIYLIKSQHEERTVSSTYVWKLSERFAKKRLPLRRLRRIMLFLLQLMMIVLSAIMAAKPVIVKGESYDYVVILDGSASMQTMDEKGRTRFENAVKAIEKQAQDLSDGHSMTVILAGDTASCLIEGSESSAEVKLALSKASCANGTCNIPEALALAQGACDRSDNAKVLFYTDCAYEKAGNITVVNMNRDEWNVALTALSVKESDEKTVFTGSLISYYKNADVTVGLAIDGKTVDAKIVTCEKDVATEVVFEKQKLKAFDTVEIYVESKDALTADNRFALCQQNRTKRQVLLVSQSPLYLESALTALENCQVTVVSSVEEATLEGMDLYIFDGITPEEYPTDGSVVVFGTEHLPDGLQCGTFYDSHALLSKNEGLKSEFYDGLTFYGAAVKEYTGLLGNRDWVCLLYCDGVPVMVSSIRENGARFAVFSFDLHDSNLPLLADYPILMNNLLEHCIPAMLTKTDYAAGEEVTVFSLPGTEEAYLQYPDDSVKTLYMNGEQSVLRLNEVGVYTVVMKGEQGGSYTDFFVHIPEEEVQPQVGDEINIAIMKEPTEKPQMAISGVWFWFALAFLLILLIEWEWYYYEQY